MDCKRVKELILSDFLDNEALEDIKSLVKSHIDTCADCKALYDSLLSDVSGPLRNSGRFNPPESVWFEIKRAIEKEPSKNPLTLLGEKISLIFNYKKTVLTAATAIVVLMAVVFIKDKPNNTGETVNIYIEEQMEYISGLAGDTEQVNGDYNEFGTVIEEYFL